MKTTLSVLLPVLVCTGCQQPAHRIIVRHFPAEPPGTVLSVEQAEAVRRPPVLKAYHVGPYVDPHSPRVFHREHEVIVEEASGGWNRIPQSQVQRGPTVVAPDPAHVPQLSTEESQMRLREATQVMQVSREQSSNTAQVVSQLQAVTNLLSQVLHRQASLEHRTRSLEQQQTLPLPIAPATNTVPAPAPKKSTGRDPW